MAFSNKQNSEFLSSSKTILVNINNNTEMLNLLQTRSYGSARLAVGLGKVADAEAKSRAHLEKRQEKLAATVKIEEKRQEVHDRCVSFGTSLRSHFKHEPDMIKHLGMDVRWGRRNADFIEQSVHLYNRALSTPEVLDRLVAEGIEESMLQSDFALVQEYETNRQDYVRLKGECQEKVETREQSLDIARAWMTGLKTTLKALYRKNPQALESVGITVRNKRRKRKITPDGTGDTGTTSTGTTDGTDTTTTNGTDTGTPIDTTPEPPLDNGRETIETTDTIEAVETSEKIDTMETMETMETITPVGFSPLTGTQEEPEGSQSQPSKNQKKRKKKKNRK